MKTKRLEISCYGPIGVKGGVLAEEVLRQLQAAPDAEEVVVRIHSKGGDAVDGLAINSALRAHRGRKVVMIDGLACSAASVIAMAGDEIVMADGSLLMIHPSWGAHAGDADAFRARADLLDKITDAYAAEYARRTGRTPDEALALMKKTDWDIGTWMSARDAVRERFATRVGAPIPLGSPQAAALAGLRAGHLPSMDQTTDTTKHQAEAQRLARGVATLLQAAQAAAESNNPVLKEVGAELAEFVPARFAKLQASFAGLELGHEEPDGDEGKALALYAAVKQLTGLDDGLVGAVQALHLLAHRKPEAPQVPEEVQVQQILASMVKDTRQLLPAELELWRGKSLADVRAAQKVLPRKGPPAQDVADGAADLGGKPKVQAAGTTPESLAYAAGLLGIDATDPRLAGLIKEIR